VTIDDRTEWLEADGLGGFTSGTTVGVRTRRYHALLLAATTPPTGRMVLVNGFDAHLETPDGTFALTTQRYAPDVLHPDGAARIAGFDIDPWPTWHFALPGGVRLVQELFVANGSGIVVVSWTLLNAATGVDLTVRPFLSGRDYHSMHHENGAFRFEPEQSGASLTFRPYDGVPPIRMLSTGEYRHDPAWYRQFLYSAERERGLDAVEDLASPGVLKFHLGWAGDRAVWMLSAGAQDALAPPTRQEVFDLEARLCSGERDRRSRFGSALDRAADAYLVKRGSGRTIIAGYPWFTDWGRDTFIAVRGLCLATGRLSDARDILVEWAGAVSEGLLPNRFPDRGEAPEFNAVDASLWYVVAASELLGHTEGATVLSPSDRDALHAAILAIVEGCAAGTRYGIRMDADGLLAAGVPGVQLTWMDARVGDRVITPRVGKPVEVQALWLNAVDAGSRIDVRWRETFERGRTAFVQRFWIEEHGNLADVVDVDHRPGTRDETFRPNQILAVGGLPVRLLDGRRARRVVEAVEEQLVTPLGLRSLAPGEPGYAGRYEGGPADRDAVYHQGTVWPWLLGAFVDAWVEARGRTDAARAEARRRFVEPLFAHVASAGLGHVSEIADAEPPFTPRGCPFQAWSLGELIRMERMILAPRRAARPSKKREAAWA
jgi:predicted glycogen debranching enzyme